MTGMVPVHATGQVLAAARTAPADGHIHSYACFRKSRGYRSNWEARSAARRGSDPPLQLLSAQNFPSPFCASGRCDTSSHRASCSDQGAVHVATHKGCAYCGQRGGLAAFIM
jgi:hypothetical protein